MSTSSGGLAEDVSYFRHLFEQLATNIDEVVLGKPDVVRRALVCLFAQGHLLIEDVPGVAKTSLAKCIASSIQGSIRRIQFTPDLLPSDILGVEIFHQSDAEFVFRPGPIFANVVLADEINRATPKTQSALLEAMAEYQISVAGKSYRLTRPFFCVATQNPIEHQGTFPLPEAQLDRFMMRLSIGYPDVETETSVLLGTAPAALVRPAPKVITVEQVTEMMDTVQRVTVEPPLARYVADIAAATRGPEGMRRGLRLGVSPRGCQALISAARAQAASEGRDHVTPWDIDALAVPVLSHRVLLERHIDPVERPPTKIISELVGSTRSGP